MRFITEAELRDTFASGTPERFVLPPGAKLTPAARQYLADLRLPVVGAESVSASRTGGAERAPKPEHMTHLNAREMVLKTHPGIVLRGKLDSLESRILLTMLQVPDAWRAPLSDALGLVRRVLGADVKGEPLGAFTLMGLDEAGLRRASHHPQEQGFGAHILPGPEHGLVAAQFNELRTLTRETELACAAVYVVDGRAVRDDLLQALNRLSSFFYVLQLRAAQAHLSGRG